MTRSLIVSLPALFAAFAIANEGGKAAATEKPAAESTTEAEVVTEAADAEAVETPKNAAIQPLKDEAQVEAIRKAFGSQRDSFDTFEAAYDRLSKISEAKETENLFGLPVVVVGYSAESDSVDPTVYEGSRAVLALVGARGVSKAGSKDVMNSYKAVVIFPIPTLATFLGTDQATVDAIPQAQREWLDKIVVKESSHVAFRNFRDANTLAELENGAKAAPKSVEEYVTASTRDGNGLNTDTFDALWNAFRTMLRKQQPAIYDLLPSKPEVIKAIRSKSYAESQDELAELEKHGTFTKIAKMLIQGAKQNKNKDGQPDPLDESALVEWLEGRDTLELTAAQPKAKDFSVLADLNW